MICTDILLGYKCVIQPDNMRHAVVKVQQFKVCVLMLTIEEKTLIRSNLCVMWDIYDENQEGFFFQNYIEPIL